MDRVSTTAGEQNSQRLISIVPVPTAILGVVAFFLPWFQVACGPIKFSFSGYDMASGAWAEKLDLQRQGPFQREMERQLGRGRLRPKTRASKQKEPSEQGDSAATGSAPLLWAVPLGCAALLIPA